jgi:hypothetical protein
LVEFLQNQGAFTDTIFYLNLLCMWNNGCFVRTLVAFDSQWYAQHFSLFIFTRFTSSTFSRSTLSICMFSSIVRSSFVRRSVGEWNRLQINEVYSLFTYNGLSQNTRGKGFLRSPVRLLKKKNYKNPPIDRHEQYRETVLTRKSILIIVTYNLCGNCGDYRNKNPRLNKMPEEDSGQVSVLCGLLHGKSVLPEKPLFRDCTSPLRLQNSQSSLNLNLVTAWYLPMRPIFINTF